MRSHNKAIKNNNNRTFFKNCNLYNPVKMSYGLNSFIYMLKSILNINEISIR